MAPNIQLKTYNFDVINRDQALLLANRPSNSFPPDLRLMALLNSYPKQITVTTFHSKQTGILQYGYWTVSRIRLQTVTTSAHGVCFAAEFLKAGAQELCLSGKRTLHWSEDMKAVIKALERASVLIQDIKTSHVSSTALSRTAVVWHRLVPAHVE